MLTTLLCKYLTYNCLSLLCNPFFSPSVLFTDKSQVTSSGSSRDSINIFRMNEWIMPTGASLWSVKIEFTNRFRICNFYEHGVIIKEIGRLNFVAIKHLFILIWRFFSLAFWNKTLSFPIPKQKLSLSSERSSQPPPNAWLKLGLQRGRNHDIQNVHF